MSGGRKIKYLFGMIWRAWLAPTPLPPLLRCTESGGGEGGGELLMSRVLPGNSEQGELLWRNYLAGKNGDSIGRTKVATHSGGPKWRLFSADQNGEPFVWVNLAEGESIWRVYSAGFC
jgi:hypothetical protein